MSKIQRHKKHKRRYIKRHKPTTIVPYEFGTMYAGADKCRPYNTGINALSYTSCSHVRLTAVSDWMPLNELSTWQLMYENDVPCFKGNHFAWLFRHGTIEMLKFAHDNGANLDKVDINLALIMNCSDDMLEYLIVNSSNEVNTDDLHYACVCNLSTFKTLVKFYPYHMDRTELSICLMVASMSDNLPIVKYLHEAGADISVMARMWAKKVETNEVANYFAQCDTHDVKIEGKTVGGTRE